MTIIEDKRTKKVFAGFAPSGKARWVDYADGMIVAVYVTEAEAEQAAGCLVDQGFDVQYLK